MNRKLWCFVTVFSMCGLVIQPPFGVAQSEDLNTWAQKAAATVQQRINELSRRKDKQLQQAITAVDFSQPIQADDIDERIQVIQDLLSLIDRFNAVLRAGAAAVLIEPPFNQLDPAVRRNIYTHIKQALDEALSDEIILKNQLDRQWALLQIERLRFLYEHRYDWRYDPNERFIDSENAAFLNEFNRFVDLTNEIQNKANTHLEAIQQRLLPADSQP